MRVGIPQLLAIALCIVSFGITPFAEAACSAGPCALVWEDNFDGTALDASKWTPMIGNGCSYGLCGWGNNELQYYRAENAVVAGGNLTITAKQENFGGANYTSARLRTLNKGDWTYGRFEMRAQLPVGQGMWPAFWMLPSGSPYGTWASSGEIDIMETVGHQPAKVHGTIHFGDAYPANTSAGVSYDLPGNNPTAFHVYAVEWEPYEIRWYIDGVLYATQTSWWSAGGSYPAPFDVDFHLLLNLAVGGNWPGDPDGSTSFPQNYVIDYVRVYQLPEASPSLVFDDMEHGNPFGTGWFTFNGAVGGGGLDPNVVDLPPSDGGSFSIQTGWGSGGTPGELGGFGRYHPVSIPTEMTDFSMWINPDAGQDYILSIKLKEDDNGDADADDEFFFNCVISPSGPCAIAGGGWQQLSIPFTAFIDDNSFLPGGNGIFDPVATTSGGNGELKEIVMVIVSNSGADATFRTDYWSFSGELADTDGDGISDAVDNCTDVANPLQQDDDADGHGNICDADFDNSCGPVDFTDLSAFKAFFFNDSNPAFDLDSSGGPVDFTDLAIFQELFFTTPGPSAAGNCP